jgi:NTP pyrophosphatase (non-canonical NTP hydrolase)
MSDAYEAIKAELARAEEKWPEWPEDPVHAAAVVVEEAGELMRASLRYTYEDKHMVEMVDEAVQVGAMAVRFINNIMAFKKRPSMQIGCKTCEDPTCENYCED